MKKFNRSFIIALFSSVVLAGCDKHFEELNSNPQSINSIDPGLLFTTALRNAPVGGLENEATVGFQFLNAYSGLTSAFNLNVYNDNYNNGTFNGIFGGPVKNLTEVIDEVKDNPDRSNLYNMSRIWLAYNYMVLVDTYGYIPYSEAGLAYISGIPYPKYDKDSDIYASLRTELKEASAALDPAKNNEARYDMFYQGDIAKWKRLGYSILLRLGLRYSEVNPDLGKTIAQEAVAGGVMESNADNILIKFNSVNTNGINGLKNTNSNYFYFAEPFISQLKSTNDPRLHFLAGKYTNAGGDHSELPDTTTASQVGFPVGQDNVSIATYPNRVIPTAAGGGFNYSQINFNVYGNALAPNFIFTYAQVALNLAEAAQRGWISTGKTAREYYEAGVRAALSEWSQYPNGYGSGNVSIPTSIQDAFLATPGVAWNDAEALKLINTQYWIESFVAGRSEAWFNFRRTGYPMISPNPAGGGIAGDGYVHRFYYPISEKGVNNSNYTTAVSSMGADDWTTRVFWDK